MDPSIASARARIGGLALAASHDPKAYTAPARAAFLNRFVDEVDRDRLLPEPERVRRAEAARKLFYARLSLKSVQAKRRKGSSPSRRLEPVEDNGAITTEVPYPE